MAVCVSTNEAVENAFGVGIGNVLGCFVFQAEDGIRDLTVTGVQTCALPIYKTRLEAAKGSQPWTATRASIKYMDEGASPALRDHSQELTVLILLVTGQGATRRPPAQSRKPRRPLLIRSASQEQTNPMQPWDKDGLAGGMRVALFDAGQAQGFTRADRAQSLGFETFRFFQYGGIPNQQPFLPSCFPLHNPLICSPQEKRIDLFGFPPVVVD